jgi:hypothetical protein
MISLLILTLAVEYAIFSMERTKYLKKDMSEELNCSKGGA